MLTEIYIEAFDKELADQVWGVWDAVEICELDAICIWLWIACSKEGVRRDSVK